MEAGWTLTDRGWLSTGGGPLRPAASMTGVPVDVVVIPAGPVAMSTTLAGPGASGTTLADTATSATAFTGPATSATAFTGPVAPATTFTRRVAATATPARPVRASIGRWLAATLGTLLVTTLLLLGFAAWLSVRPVAGEWNVRVPLWHGSRAPHILISVPRALQLATHPAVARFLHRRRIDTPVGLLRLAWHPATGTLAARCAPCTLRLESLGPDPVHLPSATLSLRRDGERRFEGSVASGSVRLPWRAALTRRGARVEGELPPAALADLHALLGAALPASARAWGDGTAGAAWRVELPEGAWTVRWLLSDAWASAERFPRAALTAGALRAAPGAGDAQPVEAAAAGPGPACGSCAGGDPDAVTPEELPRPRWIIDTDDWLPPMAVMPVR